MTHNAGPLDAGSCLRGHKEGENLTLCLLMSFSAGPSLLLTS